MTTTDFAAMKSEIAASPTNALWDVLRRAILGTEDACVRYIYARAELNARGFRV